MRQVRPVPSWTTSSLTTFMFFSRYCDNLDLHSFPTRRSSDLIALNIAKLHALDLARDGAELARRVDLDFDAALRGFLDFVFVEFYELVLGLVDRRGAELHNEIRGGRRNRAKSDTKSASEAKCTSAG